MNNDFPAPEEITSIIWQNHHLNINNLLSSSMYNYLNIKNLLSSSMYNYLNINNLLSSSMYNQLNINNLLSSLMYNYLNINSVLQYLICNYFNNKVKKTYIIGTAASLSMISHMYMFIIPRCSKFSQNRLWKRRSLIRKRDGVLRTLESS